MGTTSSTSEDTSKYTSRLSSPMNKTAYLIVRYNQLSNTCDVNIYGEPTPTSLDPFNTIDICLEQATAETFDEASSIVLQNFNKPFVKQKYTGHFKISPNRNIEHNKNDN